MILKDPKNELLFVGFNQDYGCFACGTDNGFIVYNCDPLKERFKRESENGGVGIVEMLFRCNILALVGGGKVPRFPNNKVMIWDDYQNKCIAELEFRVEVKAVKLRRDRIVVALATRVYVYNFADLQVLQQIETSENPKGLCALSSNANNTVLACLGTQPGFAHIELYDSKQVNIFQAHNGPLSQLVLSMDGSLLATSSDKGTLIRIFNTQTKQKLHEFRRGADKADIYSIAYHPDLTWICVCSDKGTAHIYSLTGAVSESNSNNNNNEAKPANRQSNFSFMKDILPSYFSSEWSFAQFRLPCKSICCFGQGNSVIAICADGSYFKYTFDPTRGGEATFEGSASFLKNSEDA